MRKRDAERSEALRGVEGRRQPDRVISAARSHVIKTVTIGRCERDARKGRLKGIMRQQFAVQKLVALMLDSTG